MARATTLQISAESDLPAALLLHVVETASTRLPEARYSQLSVHREAIANTDDAQVLFDDIQIMLGMPKALSKDPSAIDKVFEPMGD